MKKPTDAELLAMSKGERRTLRRRRVMSGRQMRRRLHAYKLRLRASS